MTSNISINNGTIASGALSDFADIYMYGDEIPLPITDITLSKTGLSCNQAAGTTIGALSVSDANIFDTHTYSLVSGSGDTNNGSFKIVSDTLKTAAVLAPGSYSIRLRASDGTYTLDKNYSITVSEYPIVTPGDPANNSDSFRV